jgi:hypothetical protein
LFEFSFSLFFLGSFTKVTLFLDMFLLEPFSAILLAVTLSIYVKAETHTVVFINKCQCVALLDLLLDPLLLTRELVAVQTLVTVL